MRISEIRLATYHNITGTHYVVPAGIAGIQKPGMASYNHILVAWIPAVHAGMKGYFYEGEKLTGGGEICFDVIEQAHKNVRMTDYLKTDTFEHIHAYFLKAST